MLFLDLLIPVEVTLVEMFSDVLAVQWPSMDNSMYNLTMEIQRERQINQILICPQSFRDNSIPINPKLITIYWKRTDINLI